MADLDAAVADFVKRLIGQQGTIPDRSVDTDIAPTPSLSPPVQPQQQSTGGYIPPLPLSTTEVKPKVKDLDEPKAIYLDMTDAKGNPVIVFSTTGELKTAGEFAKALSTYNTKGVSPAGFITQKANIDPSGAAIPDTMQGRLRQTFEEGPGRFARETLPAAGRAVGTATGVSPLIALAERAGILPSGTGTVTRQALGTGGEATGRFIGQQIDEPAELGMAVGTGVGSLPMKAVGSTGALPKGGAMVYNALMAMLSGGAGATAGRTLTGEDIDPKTAMQDYGIAALGGATTLVGHWISKHISGDMQEKVAKGVIDTFKQRFPVLNARDNVLDIAMSSPENLNKLSQQLSSGLMDTVEKESKALLNNVYSTLPSSPTVGQKVSLSGYGRRLVEAMQKRVDAIGDSKAYPDAQALVQEKADALIGEITKIYSPKVKNIDPTQVRVAQVLQDYRDSLTNVEEGTKILHLIKESGGDLNKLARMIQGDYQAIPGSQKERIGEILGQGRPLTSMPPPDAPPKELTGTAGTILELARNLPGMKSLARIPNIAKGPQVPWPSPGVRTSRGMSPGSIPMQPLVNFGAQEAGQSAIRSFLEKKE